VPVQDAAALSLLREQPTAVVCSSDALAFAVCRVARSLGLSVPDDVSVVGFDDSAPAAFATPALTSVRVDYAEFGAAAPATLLAAIDGAEPPVYSASLPELVVRASTALRRRR
jgi:DNA-binding LacI/PurR family transcriptional regulator